MSAMPYEPPSPGAAAERLRELASLPEGRRPAARPRRRLSLLAALPLVFQGAAARDAERAEAVDLEALRAHVAHLASPELEGRRDGEGARKAREYVAAAFRKAGLEPAGAGGFFQEIPGRDGKPHGANVIGRLQASGALAKEHVILSAHHDHLGKRGEQVFHGADDNATGVAALLEAARLLAARRPGPKRSVLFISFDLEEQGLLGSRHFVESPPVPLESVALFINMDMLGRNLGDVIEGYVFVLGAEHSPPLKELVREAAAGLSVKPGLVGTDLIGTRGDYGPFRDRSIPFLFFSTGEHPDYHQPTDTPERILYDKLLDNTRIALRVLAAAADLDERPRFVAPQPDLDEIRLLAEVLPLLGRRSKELGLGLKEVVALAGIKGTLDQIIARGTVTAEEREQLKAVVQGVMEAMRRW
jgi:hypothetical protein